MSDLKISAASNRRRRRRRDARRAIMASDGLGYALGLAMALLFAVYVGWAFHRVDKPRENFGWIAYGLPKAQLEYQLGAPQGVLDGGKRWQYRNGAQTLSLGFDEQGRFSDASCTVGGTAPQSCPIVLGVSIGASEARVLHNLGRPDKVTFAQGRKSLHYRGLGYAFQVYHGQVESLTYQKPESGLARLSQVAWTLLP